MSLSPNERPEANYLAPTESSARKNIGIDNFYQSPNTSNRTMKRLIEELKHRSPNAKFHTPSKMDDNTHTTTYTYQNPDGSTLTKIETKTYDSNYDKYMTLSDDMNVRRSRFDRSSHSLQSSSGSKNPQVIEKVMYHTTRLSPVGSKSKITTNKSSLTKRDYRSASKTAKKAPPKTAKKTVKYLVQAYESEMGIKFDNKDNKKLKKLKMDDLVNSFMSSSQSKDGLRKSRFRAHATASGLSQNDTKSSKFSQNQMKMQGASGMLRFK